MAVRPFDPKTDVLIKPKTVRPFDPVKDQEKQEKVDFSKVFSEEEKKVSPDVLRISKTTGVPIEEVQGFLKQETKTPFESFTEKLGGTLGIPGAKEFPVEGISTPSELLAGEKDNKAVLEVQRLARRGELGLASPSLLLSVIGGTVFPPLRKKAGRKLATDPTILKQVTGLAKKVLGPIGRQAPPVLGSAAGGAIGATAEGRDPIETGLTLGAAELAGRGLGGLISKALIRKLPSIDEKTAINFLKEHNVPVDPAQFVKSRTAKVLSFFTEKFLPARIIKDTVYRKQAITALNNIITDLPQTVGKVRGDVEIKNAVIKHVQSNIQNAIKTSEPLQAIPLRKIDKIIKQLDAGLIPSEKMTAEIFVKGNEGSIIALRKILPKDVFNDLAALNLTNLINTRFLVSETKALGTLAPGVRAIDGKALGKYLTDNKQLLESIYGKKTVEALTNLSIASKFTTTTKQTGAEIVKSAVPFAAAIPFFPITVMTTSVLSPFLVRSLMRPNGIMKAVLTTGFPRLRKTIKTGLKVGKPALTIGIKKEVQD